MAQGDEYKDRYFGTIEKRLEDVEEKSHTHNGSTQSTDLPSALKDVEVIKVIVHLLIVVIVAYTLFKTGENIVDL